MGNNRIFFEKLSIFFNVNLRQIFGYIIIGIISIVIELSLSGLCEKLFRKLNLYENYIFVFVGICSAFILNTKYNFKIPKIFKFKSFIFFFIISNLSYLIQNIAYIQLKRFGKINSEIINFEIDRLLFSSLFFLLAFYLHLLISFKDRKKIGYAYYPTISNDPLNIYNKLYPLPNFLHIDIVDKSFNSKAIKVNYDYIKLTRTLWKNFEIQCHLMTRYPLKYIKEISQYIDVFFIHVGVVIKKKSILKVLKKKQIKFGLVININAKNSEIKFLDSNINSLDKILILCVKNPGLSGQKFDNKSYKIISKVKSICLRNDFNLSKIYIDGGINKKIIEKIDMKNFISASYIENNNKYLENFSKLKFNF